VSGRPIAIVGSEWDRAPRVDPDGYPGPVPPFPYRFGGSWIEPIEEPQVVEELGRHPVAILAYGSNACPGQLRRKLGEQVEPALAVLPVDAEGLLVTFAALRASYGSVPATVVAAPGSSRTHVLLLPEERALQIDATEGSYLRLALDPEVHPVCLAGGGRRLERCETYVALAGPLLDDDGSPVPLAALDQPAARALLGSAGADRGTRLG
jgi:hypothetical protein